MPYTSRSHFFRIHKVKIDITLLSLSDSANFNHGVKTRSDILNERLSPKPNLLLTLSRLRNTSQADDEGKEIFKIYLAKIAVLLFIHVQLTLPLILLTVLRLKLFDTIRLYL